MAKFTATQLVQPVLDLDGIVLIKRFPNGAPIMDDQGRTFPILVREVLRNSLTQSFQDFPEDEKRSDLNYALAKKIMNVAEDQPIELDSSDIAYIKQKMVRGWGQEVFGFVSDVLEGRDTVQPAVVEVPTHKEEDRDARPLCDKASEEDKVS
jgi:hypothetical protein